MNLKEIKTLLGKNGLRPQKKFGQNFLFESNAIQKIISAGQIKENDTVLEIGPGAGNLTREIARQANKTVAVEKDRNMVFLLKKEFSRNPKIEIIQEDILKFDLSNLPKNYKVIANLPFYLTAPIVHRLLESENRPNLMVLIIQKEVAQRICAKPPQMSLLAASVQFYADAKVMFYVSKKNFWPKPEVDAAAILITPFAQKPKPESARIFFEVVKAGFSQPRKQLANNFSKHFKIKREETEKRLSACGIDPSRRAQTLGLQEWINLARSRFPNTANNL